MREPVVAIIGRPNVGKSTLVNRIVGSRKAIVDDLPGVTRDRAYYEAEWLDKHFTLVDTGGLDLSADGVFTNQVNEQVMVALAEADVVIFVVDGQAGVTAVDEDIAHMIRKMKKPVIVAVNKIDSREHLGLTSEFYSLGLEGDPMPLSAMHGTVGVGDMLDKMMAILKSVEDLSLEEQQDEEGMIRLAFVGRPNVGKSSLVNKLIGEDRTIVSEISGTTRDAIDSRFEWEGQPFTLVDTAGIRRKGKVSYGVEMFSVDRAIRSLKRADVTVLVIDATEGITDQDKRIIETSNESGRGLILVMNKWDLIPAKSTTSTNTAEKQLYNEVPHAKFAPVVFTSAKSGQRIENIFKLAVEVHANTHRRISTSVVNQLIHEAYTLNQPPPVKNKRLKIYYATQVSVAPPTFLLFVNSDKLLKEGYRRYLENRLRENIEFKGAPIVLACRNKDEKDTKG